MYLEDIMIHLGDQIAPRIPILPCCHILHTPQVQAYIRMPTLMVTKLRLQQCRLPTRPGPTEGLQAVILSLTVQCTCPLPPQAKSDCSLPGTHGLRCIW